MIIYIVCAVMTIAWVQQFFVKKDHYCALTYIWAGIYVPLFFYQLGWSRLIDRHDSGMFNYIFIMLAVLTLVFTYITKGMKPAKILPDQKIRITSTGRTLLPILNIGFVGLYLIENYLGSGSFIPGLQHIDIHTYSAPIISYLTNSPFIVMAADYYAFKATKKKKYLLWVLVVMVIPFITRSARMQMMICAVQFVSLFLFFEAASALNSIRQRKNYRRTKRIIIIVGMVAVIGLLNYTNYRMNHYGVYSFSYSDLIGYDGPEWASFMAVYYGYFPLSFNNLKINILNRVINHNFIGLYSFTCFYFGVLQLDNILGIDTNGHLFGKLVTQTNATVPTGFWDYYYDYDILCFIPVIVAFLLCYDFLKKANKEKTRLTYRSLYFWFVPLWFFMSFQNVLFESTVIIAGALLLFVIQTSFEVEKIEVL